MNDKYVVTAFSFWDFCVAVQDAVTRGYVFDDSNENMPQAYVGSYSCIMIKNQSVDATKTDDVGDLDSVNELDKPQTATRTSRKTTK